jgi:monooxygenase
MSEHVDILIVGAGLSGIGAAHVFRERLPGRSLAIVEAREASGGTWDLFRYPGIRSDSDLHTFGYDFRPWIDRESIAGGDRILDYLRQTAHDDGTEDLIRYGHRVVSADWREAEQLWHVLVEHGSETIEFTCVWFFCASGYYSYAAGHTPTFEGSDDFAGRIVHPQLWPADLDLADKNVVIIGSGATAVTIVPAIAETAAKVTMLQRTPSYILPLASVDRFARAAHRVLGPRLGHRLARARGIAIQRLLWNAARRFPNRTKAFIRGVTAKQLPEGYPVDEHFTPPYNPWDQRLCFVPDGDFFRAIRRGTAEVVTDRIRRFDTTGIELESGKHLDTDVIVTATGLEILIFGGMRLSIDGEPIDLSERVAYRGVMLDGVPNFSYAIGYTNASWTLKIGLVCDYVARMIARLGSGEFGSVRPVVPAGMETRPLLDFGAGYVQRAIAGMPRQGTLEPWTTSTGYHDDLKLIRRARLDDPLLRYDRVKVTA